MDSAYINSLHCTTLYVSVWKEEANEWDFQWNEEYDLYDNVTKEWIPGKLAGDGTPFTITYSMQQHFKLHVKQDE